MDIQSQARIISYNLYGEEICASAARISTTSGNAIEIFENAQANEKNSNLINKVLTSGHKSLIEHAVFTIALCNVSAFVEQFFIECRLASFTVKSRRYVDFGKTGYYIPADLNDTALTTYRGYMDLLFAGYQSLLERGIPKEDARFILPYAFHSNFYCTLNARELVKIIHTIRIGRGREIPELQDLADQIIRQIEVLASWLLPELTPALSVAKFSMPVMLVSDTVSFLPAKETGSVELIDFPAAASKLLDAAYRVSHPNSTLSSDLNRLLLSERARELEQLSYSFFIADVTLSGVTHIVRHRMQSVIVSPIQAVNHSRFILPSTVKNEQGALTLYADILREVNAMASEMGRDPALQKYSYYFALSGNMMDIMTTLNARELKHFIQLRSCNRAQWEVRKIAIDMLKQLRRISPELFDHFGPSCYLNGTCPEGRLTCGKKEQVISEFMPPLQLGNL